MGKKLPKMMLRTKAISFVRGVLVFAIVASSFMFIKPVSAATLTPRSLTLSSSAPTAANATTTYTFAFTTITNATFQSIAVQICTTPSGTCTTPTGFTNASSAFGSTTLSGTWTNNTAGGANVLRASASGASATAPSSRNFVWNNVQNPTTANQSFYGRITLYSDTGWATPVDTGTVGASTSQLITVTATVDESLIFCTGTTSTTGGANPNCTGMSGSTVALGLLDASSTKTGTSLFTIATNAASGYTVTYTGVTLTSGGNTIAAMNPAGTSQIGTSEFGLNLVANTTPSVGAASTGPGSPTLATGYNTANTFKFLTGDTIASTASSTNSDFEHFTVSYMANIAGNQAAGAYTTTLTYIGTGNF